MSKLGINLTELRQTIDALDAELITLLANRMKVVQQVGQYKAEHGIAPLAPERWQQVLISRKTQADQAGLSSELVTEIWELIHQHALKMEAEEQHDE